MPPISGYMFINCIFVWVVNVVFLKFSAMIPNKYRSEHVRLLSSIESRRAKDGKVFFYVEILHSLDVGLLGFRFDNLSSAIEFLKCNLSSY